MHTKNHINSCLVYVHAAQGQINLQEKTGTLGVIGQKIGISGYPRHILSVHKTMFDRKTYCHRSM